MYLYNNILCLLDLLSLKVNMFIFAYSNKRPLAFERQTSTLISKTLVGKEVKDMRAKKKKPKKKILTTII